ncbi:unnamed protein product [Gongylonema pulchrum]|uniref:Uncharacterized protein n=1 Tax=Gongylonema pulchrum TaxID=637853 RepID=A0A183E075_9BILA|nr:unnamed protein product [Gongylonema pulchrum]
MDSTTAVHLRNALSAPLVSSTEKPMLPPVDISAALSLLARPATATIPTPFPPLTPFSFSDPTTLFTFSQQLRSTIPNYSLATVVSPLLPSTGTVTTATIPRPSVGPPPLKRPNRETHQQPVPSSPSCCSSSSVTSSCSPPQQSPHRKQAAPVPDDKKVGFP